MSRRSLAPPCEPASCTATIAWALITTCNHTTRDDYLFLEARERRASTDLSALLCIAQIRRVNPALAAELRAEIATARPLTETERL